MTHETALSAEPSRAEAVARHMHGLLIAGEFTPGEKLSEHQAAARFGISRNTLREVFRLLSSQGLVRHIPNRGVFVAAPDAADVVDIYRARAVIQHDAVRAATRGHPALGRMRALSDQAQDARGRDDWRAVGTLNMEFHRAMVGLCDSPRLDAAFALILAELRLVFGQLDDTAHLHDAYVDLNQSLLAALEAGDGPAAARRLDEYLRHSERAVLGALERARGRMPHLSGAPFPLGD